MPGDGDDLAVAHGVPETIGQRRRSIEAKDSAGRHVGLAVPTPHRSGSSRRPIPAITPNLHREKRANSPIVKEAWRMATKAQGSLAGRCVGGAVLEAISRHRMPEATCG